MVDEKTGGQGGRTEGNEPKDQNLPDFMHPETGSSDAANPNLAEIESILSSGDESADDAPMTSGVETSEPLDGSSLKRGRSRSIIAWVVLAVSLLLVIRGGILIASSEKLQSDLKCFFTGNIAKCKHHKVEVLQAQWRQEDQATRPMYGDFTLVDFYPDDAKIRVTQTARERKGWNGPLSEPSEPNVLFPKKELAANEVIKPPFELGDLPIRTRKLADDGSVAQVTEYQYKVVLEREGYEPREFDLAVDSWQKLGPTVNYTVQIDGVDLVRKPETAKGPFAEAMFEITCERRYFEEKGEKEGMSPASLDAEITKILIRHGFQTRDEFNKFSAFFEQDKEWWTAMMEDLKKKECPPREAAE